MQHSWLCCVVAIAMVFLGVCAVGNAVAEDSSSGFGSAKRPLDLPAGGYSPDEEEEDAPETIFFYGGELEGDCFVFVFPAYGFCGDTTVFQAIRTEISMTLTQLSDNSKFSLVGFNSQSYVWAPTVRPANAQNKSLATAWMNVLVPVEAHCIVDAAVTGLSISQQANSDHKQLVICGARTPYCNGQGGSEYVAQALMDITSANYEQSPLHTVYFTSPFYSGEQEFYQQLAAMNSGTYKHVPY